MPPTGHGKSENFFIVSLVLFLMTIKNKGPHCRDSHKKTSDLPLNPTFCVGVQNPRADQKVLRLTL